ncbi:hypothetical protein C8F04DRAFT_1171830, partial [Mycena alexandri]
VHANLYNTKVRRGIIISLFIEELSINFGPHDPVGDAEDRIRLCRMKNGDQIATYVLAFDILASLMDWGDAALRHQFYEGLPRCSKFTPYHRRIKDEMMVARNINACGKLEQAVAGRSGNRSGPPDNTGERTGKGSGKQKEKGKGGNNTKPPGNSSLLLPTPTPGINNLCMYWWRPRSFGRDCKKRPEKASDVSTPES